MRRVEQLEAHARAILAHHHKDFWEPSPAAHLARQISLAVAELEHARTTLDDLLAELLERECDHGTQAGGQGPNQKQRFRLRQAIDKERSEAVRTYHSTRSRLQRELLTLLNNYRMVSP